MLIGSNWICLLDALMCRIWSLWRGLSKCLNLWEQCRYTWQNKLRGNANRNSDREVTVTLVEWYIEWKNPSVPNSGDLSLKGGCFLRDHCLLGLTNEPSIPLTGFSSNEHFSSSQFIYRVPYPWKDALFGLDSCSWTPANILSWKHPPPLHWL